MEQNRVISQKVADDLYLAQAFMGAILTHLEDETIDDRTKLMQIGIAAETYKRLKEREEQ